jgi:ethanolamine permease
MASQQQEHPVTAGGALQKTLGPVHIWGLAVGLVISGEYFGWSLGWGEAGPLGFLVSTLIVVVLYTTLVFSLTELTTAIPDAGGPFAYASRALGPWVGFLAAAATVVEFVFAPPAIAFALGGYLSVLFDFIPQQVSAVLVLCAFGVINLSGVHQSAKFELVVTVLAIMELVLFIVMVAPYFNLDNFLTDAWMGGVGGIFAALPYAIWFFLAIEGVAMTAEEVRDPKRTIPLGYISGIITLVVLALGVMLAAGGAGDWKALSSLDYPIPKAMQMTLGEAHPLVKVFAAVGVFGLVASLNGIVLGASRQLFAVGRAGALPAVLARTNRAGAPWVAVIVCTVIGVIGILSGRTGDLITMSALGAVVMYMLCMISLLVLRKKEPGLERPFKAPLYPWFPLTALTLSGVCLAAMVYYHAEQALIFACILVAGGAYFAAKVARVKPERPSA